MHAPEPPVIEGATALAQVDAWRHRDLKALAQASLPAIVDEIVRDRGEHIGDRGPDVAPAVAGEVDRMLHEARGHELRLPHGARPRSEHSLAADMALLQNEQ